MARAKERTSGDGRGPGVAGSASGGHIRELDGLRAVAVALVFLNHFAPIRSFPRLRIVAEIGWIGVDVFFVISGFLIVGILLDSRQQPDYYRNFYIRRSLRIFPLYYVVLIVVLSGMVLSGSGGAAQMAASWGSPAWLFAYLGNVRTALTNVSPPAAFVPMWSLHVEEQFYLVFPLLVRHLRRENLRRMLVGLVIIAPLTRLALAHALPDRPLIEYMLLPCRMDGLALGALIALRLRTWDRAPGKHGLAAVAVGLSIAAIATFVAGGRTFDSRLERTVGYSLFAGAAAAWIMWVVTTRGSWLTGWLNARPLQYLGKISYGLYLLQMPMASALEPAISALGLPDDWLKTAPGSLTLALLCVGTASLSWHAMERPLLRFKDRWAPSAAALGRPSLVAGGRSSVSFGSSSG